MHLVRPFLKLDGWHNHGKVHWFCAILFGCVGGTSWLSIACVAYAMANTIICS